MTTHPPTLLSFDRIEHEDDTAAIPVNAPDAATLSVIGSGPILGEFDLSW
jgi:hypothetical protein